MQNPFLPYPCPQRRKENWFESSSCGTGLTVKTPFYDVQFEADGSISSLFDKKMNREWANGGFNKLHLYQDTPGMYDAWDIFPTTRMLNMILQQNLL